MSTKISNSLLIVAIMNLWAQISLANLPRATHLALAPMDTLELSSVKQAYHNSINSFGKEYVGCIKFANQITKSLGETNIFGNARESLEVLEKLRTHAAQREQNELSSSLDADIGNCVEILRQRVQTRTLPQPISKPVVYESKPKPIAKPVVYEPKPVVVQSEKAVTKNPLQSFTIDRIQEAINKVTQISEPVEKCVTFKVMLNNGIRGLTADRREMANELGDLKEHVQGLNSPFKYGINNFIETCMQDLLEPPKISNADIWDLSLLKTTDISKTKYQANKLANKAESCLYFAKNISESLGKPLSGGHSCELAISLISQLKDSFKNNDDSLSSSTLKFIEPCENMLRPMLDKETDVYVQSILFKIKQKNMTPYRYNKFGVKIHRSSTPRFNSQFG